MDAATVHKEKVLLLRSLRSVVSIVLLAALGLVGVLVWRYANAVPAALAGPERFHKTIEIQPDFLMTYALEIPVTKLPGRLVGTWDCKGKSAKLPGATDDTLIEFRLLGPNGEVLQKLHRPSQGTFSLEVTVPGRYTFEFNNSGILRSSKRMVSLQGEYHVGK